ncbi:endonuclease/exonuclease/phosphatase family protein [Mycolicibacterium thermoresistibile]
MQWVRRIAGAAGVLLLIGCAAGISTHFTGAVRATLIASFTPVFVLGTLIALVVLALSRWRIAAVVAAAVLSVGLWGQWPLYRAEAAQLSTEATGAQQLRLLQANIFLGQADPEALVDRVRSEHVDVLTVSELTAEAETALAEAGLTAELPHTFLRSRPGGGGAGIYSRLPLSDGQLLAGFELHNLRAGVGLPGGAEIAVYALHLLPPYPEPPWRWATELDRLAEVLAAEDRPLVIGADVNATYDHKRFRDLLVGSEQPGSPQLTDAAVVTGSGIVPTYPAGRRTPPLLAIDRILARDATPVSFRRIDLPGSDHYGVVGDIAVDTPESAG